MRTCKRGATNAPNNRGPRTELRLRRSRPCEIRTRDLPICNQATVPYAVLVARTLKLAYITCAWLTSVCGWRSGRCASGSPSHRQICPYPCPCPCPGSHPCSRPGTCPCPCSCLCPCPCLAQQVIHLPSGRSLTHPHRRTDAAAGRRGREHDICAYLRSPRDARSLPAAMAGRLASPRASRAKPPRPDDPVHCSRTRLYLFKVSSTPCESARGDLLRLRPCIRTFLSHVVPLGQAAEIKRRAARRRLTYPLGSTQTHHLSILEPRLPNLGTSRLRVVVEDCGRMW